jgi:hypothetical protein
LNPKITSSGGDFNLTQLTDVDIATIHLLPSDPVSGNAWIQFEFKKPQTFKSITIGGDREWLVRYLEVSDDGDNFHRVCYIPGGGILQQTMPIPVTTASFFRVTFNNCGLIV